MKHVGAIFQDFMASLPRVDTIPEGGIVRFGVDGCRVLKLVTDAGKVYVAGEAEFPTPEQARATAEFWLKRHLEEQKEKE